jgi:hypothetical protein
MNHCTIDKSAGNGLFVNGTDSDNNNPLTAYNANTISNCQLYPINAISTIAGSLDGTASSYSGNSNNENHVERRKIIR